MNNTETLQELRRQGYKVFISHKRPLKVVNLVSPRNTLTGYSDVGFFTRHQMNNFILDKFGVPIDNFGDYIYEKGGLTKVTICDQNGNTVVEGYADCSMKDNYSRKLGLHIALSRALKELKS